MNIKDYNFKGQRAFVRVDFNVPLENGKITDDTRIRGAMPTLKKIIGDGGRLIIASHLGRPEKNPDPKYSLRQIVDTVSEYLGVKIAFAPDCGKARSQVDALGDGEALMLENTENLDETQKAEAKKAMKEAQKQFAATLASYADCYVNDAFGTAHRAHASTALIADFFNKDHKMYGFLMEKEVNAVKNVMYDPKRPFTAIMGGSKVSSKIDIIRNLMNKVDNLIVTGGMTYTFTKALGGKIGNSICEDDKLSLALELISKAKAKGVRLVMAVDAKIADKFANDANTQFVDDGKIPDGWIGMDIGPKTERLFADVIESSKTILWNGPAGVFEMDNFSHGSFAIAQAIVNATKKGAYSLVGGGDSVACVNKFGFADSVSYVSTGGGALLEAIEGKVLPGIAAIEK